MLQAVNPNAAAQLAYEIPSLKSLKSERKFAPPPKYVAEIPLRSLRDGRLVADVSVNGSESLTFLIDTGAHHVALVEATAERLGIEIDPGHTVRIAGIIGKAKAPLVTIDRMEIQGIGAESIYAVIIKKELGPGVEGLIGQNFLRKINARIDVVKKVMVIEQR